MAFNDVGQTLASSFHLWKLNPNRLEWIETGEKEANQSFYQINNRATDFPETRYEN